MKTIATHRFHSLFHPPIRLLLHHPLGLGHHHKGLEHHPPHLLTLSLIPPSSHPLSTLTVQRSTTQKQKAPKKGVKRGDTDRPTQRITDQGLPFNSSSSVVLLINLKRASWQDTPQGQVPSRSIFNPTLRVRQSHRSPGRRRRRCCPAAVATVGHTSRPRSLARSTQLGTCPLCLS